MNKLVLNINKNFGNKVKTAYDTLNKDNSLEGVYLNLSDIATKQIDNLLNSNLTAKFFFEYPFYYLLENNLYIDLLNNIGNTAKNNKIVCLSENIEHILKDNLPLTSSTFIQNRVNIYKSINSYFDKYYSSYDYVMTPTFFFPKSGSWKEYVFEDILLFTQNYCNITNKSRIILSLIIDVKDFSSENIYNLILGYINRYKNIDSISISVPVSKIGLNYYKQSEYLDYFNFLKAIRSNNINVYIQYAGIKDLIFAVLDIKAFGVGWSSSFRGLSLEQRKLVYQSTPTFGRKVQKVFLKSFMSEIPLSLLKKYPQEKIDSLFGEKTNLDLLSYNHLEQKYWSEYLKTLDDFNHDNHIYDESIIIGKIETMMQILDKAKLNLIDLISHLKMINRFDDADKIEKDQLRSIINYIDSIQEFRNSIFIY